MIWRNSDLIDKIIEADTTSRRFGYVNGHVNGYVNEALLGVF